MIYPNLLLSTLKIFCSSHWPLLLFCAIFLFTGLTAFRINHHYEHQQPWTIDDITDFRYNTARIDGITNLFNGSLIVISNGYYWVLDPRTGALPLPNNIKGNIGQLYPNFQQIDDIWTDPYNDISPQIYLVSNTPKYGLRVVCQEFDAEFTSDSKFCHLPVDDSWQRALRDLDPNKPVDAVTWRNRTKAEDGGFWVFFQGNKMITIEPYEMKLRYTYDIQKWMSINESLTAAFYDYHQSVYHLFFDNNKYFTWTVNVSYMNKLPMTWDRAFLHGTLSKEMKINKDFFQFSYHELRDSPQPNYRKRLWFDSDLENNEISKNNNLPQKHNTKLVTTVRNSSVQQRVEPIFTQQQPMPTKIESNNRKNVKKIKDSSRTVNIDDYRLKEYEKINSIDYQNQLKRFEIEGVKDFAKVAIPRSPPLPKQFQVHNFSMKLNNFSLMKLIVIFIIHFLHIYNL